MISSQTQDVRENATSLDFLDTICMKGCALAMAVRPAMFHKPRRHSRCHINSSTPALPRSCRQTIMLFAGALRHLICTQQPQALTKVVLCSCYGKFNSKETRATR